MCIRDSHNCPRDAVIYTGTHDTPTFVQWLFEQAAPAERDYAFDYLRLREDEGFGWGAVCGAWMSPCRLAIAPMQDLLGLSGDARVNTPGIAGPRNWSWRVPVSYTHLDVYKRQPHPRPGGGPPPRRSRHTDRLQPEGHGGAGLATQVHQCGGHHRLRLEVAFLPPRRLRRLTL